MNLQNKTLIVTGVASGIGAELARLARFQGATVIGVDRHAPQLTLDSFVQADLGDPASIDALVARLPARNRWAVQHCRRARYGALASGGHGQLPGAAAPDSIAAATHVGGRQHRQCRLGPRRAMAATAGAAQGPGRDAKLRGRAAVAGGQPGGAGQLLSVLQGSADRVELPAIPGLVSRSLGTHQLRRAGAGVYPDPRRFRQHARAGTGGRRQPAHDPASPGR